MGLQTPTSARGLCFYPIGRQGDFGIRFHLERKVGCGLCFKKKKKI